MRRLVIVVVLAACSEPPGSDLDGDGVADPHDDCIAGFSDETVDADGDRIDATLDLCPHDFKAAAGDVDADGIPEACDPFPATAAPDTRRCVTSFRVPWMNAAHLDARAGEQAWALTAPLTATADQSVSIVSRFPLEYPSVTLDVLGTLQLAPGSPGFRLWLRAEPAAPGPQDLACGIDRDDAGTYRLFVWANNTRNALVALPTIDGAFRLRGTVQELNTDTVLCRATVGEQSMATRFEGVAPVPGGRYGLASAMGDTTIESLVIDSNDAVQPL